MGRSSLVPADGVVAADLLARSVPEDEEEEVDDDKKHGDDEEDDDQNDEGDGYSE
jgi:hypothetical protein